MKSPHNPKRQAILEAARRAFLTNGYSGTSMEIIAETAPVSKPTLYSHFGSKHELFAAVIADRCDHLMTTLQNVPRSMPKPADGLRTIAFSFVDLVYAEESLALYRLLIAEQQHFPDLGEQVYRAAAEPTIRLLSGYLADLHQRGLLQVGDPDSASQLLLGMLKGITHFRCLLGVQESLSATEKRQLVESAVTLFLRGHDHAV